MIDAYLKRVQAHYIEKDRTQPHRGRVCLPRIGTSRRPTQTESSNNRKCRKTGERPIKQASRRIPAQSRSLDRSWFTAVRLSNGQCSPVQKTDGANTVGNLRGRRGVSRSTLLVRSGSERSLRRGGCCVYPVRDQRFRLQHD